MSGTVLGQQQRLVWHYTIGVRLSSILVDGEIKPATAFVPAGERPCVWFSATETFEPTAIKMVVGPDEIMRSATIDEMEREFDGLYRIGVARVGCIDFRGYKRLSGVASEMVRSLERVARERGASSRDWFVRFGSVPRSEWLRVQRRIDGVWRDVDVSGWAQAVPGGGS